MSQFDSRLSISQEQAHETGRRLRRFALVVALVLAGGFVTVFTLKSRQEHQVKSTTAESAAAAPLVNAITVTPSPGTLALKLPGATAAWYESVIYARVDGYVGKWTADIGDRVTKGQVLATIETPDLDAQLAASEAKMKAAEATVIARQADTDFAETTYERWRDSPKGVVSDQEREAKKAAYDSAVAQLNEARAQVTLDKADVDRYSVLARFKQVTAPYDGKITERRIDIGNLVTSGSSSNTTPLYRMTQNDPIRVFVDVPQSAAADMKTEMTAHITASNIPGRVFNGKVTRTSDAIDPQARTLKVEVDLPNRDQTLVPGMYVDVGFDVPTQGLMRVPAAALIFRSGGPEIAVIDKDDHVTFRRIEIARDNGTSVEIASGIAAGDRVALNISNQIADGEKVEVSLSKEGQADVKK
jgi:RND family efflux transporter MFP subunit